VCLRALTPADIPRWAHWFNSDVVTDQMNKGLFPNTERQQETWFDEVHRSRHDLLVGIVTRTDEQLIGVVGVHRIDWVHRRGDISIVVGERAFQGQGHGTEAIRLLTAHVFEKLNLRKLTAGMWASNVASRRSFERVGFVLEATLRQSYWRHNRYEDELRLGLLRDEWTG
jgi:RimJ/RimL family protein N-acetyltransferase